MKHLNEDNINITGRSKLISRDSDRLEWNDARSR